MFSSKTTKQQRRVVSGPTNFVHVAHGDMNSAPQDLVILGQEDFRQPSLAGPSRSADDYIDYGWGQEEVSGPTNFVRVARGDMNSAPQDLVISGQEDFRQPSLAGPSRSADNYSWGPEEEEEEEEEEDRASTHSASELPKAETTKTSIQKKFAKLFRPKPVKRTKPRTRNAQIDTEALVRQRVSDLAPPKNTSTSNLNTSTSVPVLGSQAVTKFRAGSNLKKRVSQFFGL